MGSNLFPVLDDVNRSFRTRLSLDPPVECRKKIDKNVPAGLDVHIVCGNYQTHKIPEIKDWLARHPRFHVHFTPTGSSWINQVERWFG